MGRIVMTIVVAVLLVFGAVSWFLPNPVDSLPDFCKKPESLFIEKICKEMLNRNTLTKNEIWWKNKMDGNLHWYYAYVPPEFYLLMHIIVFAMTSYLAFVSYQIKKYAWIWIMGTIAIVLNPFVRLDFSEEVFEGIYILSSIILVVSIFYITEKDSTELNNQYP